MTAINRQEDAPAWNREAGAGAGGGAISHTHGCFKRVPMCCVFLKLGFCPVSHFICLKMTPE